MCKLVRLDPPSPARLTHLHTTYRISAKSAFNTYHVHNLLNWIWLILLFRMNILWYIHIMDYYSGLKRTEHTQQDGWNSNALCYRLHIIGFHDMTSQKGKMIGTQSRSVVAKDWRWWVGLKSSMRKSWKVIELIYILTGGVVTWLHAFVKIMKP